jgi:hypothetical protein
MENVSIFYDHFEYFTTLWYNLWPFGIDSLWSFGVTVLVRLEQEKSGNLLSLEADFVKSVSDGIDGQN